MAKNIDIFDPADQEIGPELVNAIETDESMFIADTNGDPEGSEKRSTPDAIQLPDYFYKKYSLDVDNKPTFNKSRVVGMMKIFDAKKGTPIAFLGDDEEKQAKEQELFDTQVQQVVDGLMPLLEVDPQTTGINFLQLTTRTWAEFVAIAYEYKEDAEGSNPKDALPTWLIEREDKMFDLGRKARMLSAAVDKADTHFGLSKTNLDSNRVRTEIERRLQRLAEWNYNNVVDKSIKVAIDLNKQTKEHTKSMFDLA
jgi:hypothetical protein